MQKIKLFYLLVIIALIGSSCNTYKKYTYLRDLPITGHKEVIEKNIRTYEIQPGDLLYIRVITPDQTMGEIFNPFSTGGGGTSGGRTSRANIYFNGYTVSDSGYIEIPVIDSVYVGGLTLQKAKKRIQKESKKYLKESQVIVKMAGFKFTLVGEVAAEGVQTVYEDELNLIEAISYGGGVTYNGDRQNVLIMRPTEEGTKTFEVDLTDPSLVKSDLYYVQPNDLIYVKPRRTFAFRQETNRLLFGLGALSSTISTVLLLINLQQ